MPTVSFALQHGDDASLPAAFVRAGEIAPEAHIRMQAALQAHVDNAISKTINVPMEFDFDAFRSIYEKAYDMGLNFPQITLANSNAPNQIVIAGQSGVGGGPARLNREGLQCREFASSCGLSHAACRPCPTTFCPNNSASGFPKPQASSLC